MLEIKKEFLLLRKIDQQSLQFKQSPTSSLPSQASTYSRLGNVANVQGDHVSSIRYYRRALAINNEQLLAANESPAAREAVDSLIVLASAMRLQGLYQEATQYTDQAIADPAGSLYLVLMRGNQRRPAVD